VRRVGGIIGGLLGPQADVRTFGSEMLSAVDPSSLATFVVRARCFQQSLPKKSALGRCSDERRRRRDIANTPERSLKIEANNPYQN
jgi:hypothetical protein